MMRILAAGAAMFFTLGGLAAQPVAPPQALDSLVAAYPDAIERHDGTHLYWRDGTRMPVGPAAPDKPFEQVLRSASILDQFRIPYAAGPLAKPPGLNEDPGRIRNAGFFKKLYGDCEKGDVTRRLVAISWMPASWGKSVKVTPVNGVAERLVVVGRALDALPAKIRQAAFPIAGVYNCRAVADTGQPSMHGTAAAIDLNTKFAHYWHWTKPRGDPIPYRNIMPQEIVDVFEKHGFIWGGKWYHYDTMHFEYRPELLGIDNRAR